MSTTTPQPVTMSQETADSILQFALQHNMYEVQNDDLNSVPVNDRLTHASTLVEQAQRRVGVNADNELVQGVLQRYNAGASSAPAPAAAPPPPADTQSPPAPAPATPPAPPAPAPAAATPPPAPPLPDPVAAPLAAAAPPAPAAPAPAADPYASHSDDALRNGIAALKSVPSSDAILAEIDAMQNALDARAQTTQPAQATTTMETPVPAPPQATVQQPQPDMPPVPGQQPAPHTDLPPVPGRQNSGVINPGGLPDGAAPPVPEPSTAAPAAAPQASDERTQLEEQITGPMLKAWGSGRKEVPSMTLEQVRLIVSNPGGPPEGMTKASLKELGAATTDLAQVAAETPAPPAAPVVAPTPAAPAFPDDTPPAPVEQPAQQPDQQVASVPQTPSSSSSGVAKAMEIIEREHFPIPPDIDEPYELSNDISAISDAELRSLHGRAHATEARVNWVISEIKDEIADLQLLLDDRRRVVKIEAPKTEEGKRLTKDQVEAHIENDDQVKGFVREISKAERAIGKLLVIRDNAHRDCERASRQWSMRNNEETDTPGRT